MTAPQFHALTLEYVDATGRDRRKARGQYFTPRSVRDELLALLPDMPGRLRILDPACGTGEFLASLEERFPGADLEGWDIDPALVDIARRVSPGSRVSVRDALDAPAAAEYDLVVGNPPYYEFSPGPGLRERFGSLLRGRPNIFGLFVALGLDLLKEGGRLAYVLPPSMNNGAYFARLREAIVTRADIEALKVLSDPSLFPGAMQSTMLLVLRKGPNAGRFVFRRDGLMIFSEDPASLEAAFRGAVSLADLGFSVRTGRIVWNQNRDRLTDDPAGAVPLIWAHNVSEAGLRFPIAGSKPQYVRTAVADVGPAIVVNRITGSPKSGRIRAAIVPAGMRFVAENHCNVIFPPPAAVPPPSGRPATRSAGGTGVGLEDVCAQLRSPAKLRVMRNVTGNTQISKTELARLFPISIGAADPGA